MQRFLFFLAPLHLCVLAFEFPARWSKIRITSAAGHRRALKDSAGLIT
jgi:hypothetical protein